MYDPDLTPYTTIFVSSNDGDYEIKLEENKITPLPEKFIPTTVPVISTAEAGQFITVASVNENGKPTAFEAVTIPSAEGVSF
jgi:hypothetical protein